jgi:predicted phosphodiesterase
VTSNKGVRGVLVLPDLHIPEHDPRTLKAVEKFMRDYPWDEIIYLGDFLDLSCISSHNKNNLRAIEGETVIKEVNAGNAILDRHHQILPNAKKVMVFGNHDYRLERYIDANPQLKGIMEFERLLKLKERGIKFVRYWDRGEVYRIGKAAFGHGIFTGDNHAKQHVDKYGDNFFYGHIHTVAAASKVKMGDDKTVIAQCLGCLCKYRQYWMKGRPNHWIQAFGVFYFFPDGYFNYYVPMIYKHRFVSPQGVVYQG